jgi:hypothetical protein
VGGWKWYTCSTMRTSDIAGVDVVGVKARKTMVK